MLRDWRLLNESEDIVKLDDWANELEKRSSQPPRLTWLPPPSQVHHSPASYLLSVRCELSGELGCANVY
jgi:hypothetical protein